MRLSIFLSLPPSSISVLFSRSEKQHGRERETEREKEGQERGRETSTIPFRPTTSFAFALVGSRVWPASRHSSTKREKQDRKGKTEDTACEEAWARGSK